MAKKNQDEQEKPRETQEKHLLIKRNNELTYFQAKNQIYQLVQQGWNYRDIAKQFFNIQGRGHKRFSISEISKIKQEFDFLENENEIKSSKNENEDKSKVIELLKNNYPLDDIVVITKFDPQFVLQTYRDYIQLKNFQNPLDNFYQIAADWERPCNNVNDLTMLFSKALMFTDIFEFLLPNCVVCGKPLVADPCRNPYWQQDLDVVYECLRFNCTHIQCFRTN